jgi:hypothetical protein
VLDRTMADERFAVFHHPISRTVVVAFRGTASVSAVTHIQLVTSLACISEIGRFYHD